MAKKRGIPADLNLLDNVKRADDTPPEPIRAGDYLEESFKPSKVATPPAEPDLGPAPPPDTKADTPAPVGEGGGTPKPRRRKTQNIPRARLNVSEEGRERLRDVVDWVREYGPEPDVKASEVLEAAITVIHEARDRLDLSNMRRRGKFGSTSHQVYRAALADSLKRAVLTKRG